MRTINYVMCIMLLVVMFIPLVAVNHLDLMMSIVGNQMYDHFGEKLAELDFNGDGYQDLAVLQSWWVPDSIYVTIPPNSYIERNYGRILFYYGGPGFDSIPEFSIEGNHRNQFRYSGKEMYSLGDVNGDGYDDIGVREFPFQLSIYFGGLNPSTAPGYVIGLQSSTIYQLGFDTLGDINGDGYDDFSYWYYPNSPYATGGIYIVLGGSFLELFLDITLYCDSSEVDGIGDINNDGYNDFCYSIFHQPQTGGNVHHKLIYYGSSEITLANPVVLLENIPYGSPVTRGIEDVNGDGYDDFIGLIDNDALRVWYGNAVLPASFCVSLSPPYCGLMGDKTIAWGDLNADGFTDVIGAYPQYDGDNGRACIWLGKHNMNGTVDLYIYSIYDGMQFGLGIVCADFNNDGYDDLAISEPSFDPPHYLPGRVRIFSGNAQLSDTTPDVDDENAPAVNCGWNFKVIPNPKHRNESLKLKFNGRGYDKYQQLEVNIFNIKGQLVHTSIISSTAVKTGETIIDKINLVRGVYFISIFDHDQKLKTQKVTIK